MRYIIDRVKLGATSAQPVPLAALGAGGSAGDRAVVGLPRRTVPELTDPELDALDEPEF